METEFNAERYTTDPVAFYREVLGEPISPKQEELIRAATSKKHIVAIWARQTGKSTAMAKVIVYWLLFGGGERKGLEEHEYVMVFAPIQSQTTNMYNKVERLLKKYDFIWNFVDRINTEHIEMRNGNQCDFMSASPTTHIRGPSPTKIVLDESQDIPDNKYYGDIMPMGAVTNPTIIEAGTPFEKNHFYKTVTEDKEAQIIYQKWDECPFNDKNRIVAERKTMPASTWRQEYENQFIEGASTVFPASVIQAAIEDYEYAWSIPDALDINYESVMGVDLGKERDPTELTIVNVGAYPYKIMWQEAIDLGTPYNEVAARVAVVYEHFKPGRLSIDYTNEKSFTDDLMNKGVPMTPVSFNTKSKTEMISQLTVLIENRHLLLPKNDEALLHQLISQQYQTSNKSATERYTYYHPSGDHDDKLWSLALACYGVVLDQGINKENDFYSVDLWKKEKDRQKKDKLLPSQIEEEEMFAPIRTRQEVDAEVAFARMGVQNGSIDWELS